MLNDELQAKLAIEQIEKMGIPHANALIRIAEQTIGSTKLNHDQIYFKSLDGHLKKKFILCQGGVAKEFNGKGFGYIQRLVASPYSSYHVAELENNPFDALGSRFTSNDKEDFLIAEKPQEKIDPVAVRQVLKRAEDVRTEIENGSNLVDSLELELIQLENYLLEAGSKFKSSDALMVDRVNRCIVRAIDTLSEYFPEIADHLTSHIKTGSFCVYEGDWGFNC